MNDRRDFLKTTGAALSTSLFSGRVRGANDRVSVVFIGMGRQGIDNLGSAIHANPDVVIPAVCDIYDPALEKAVAASGRAASGKPDARPKARPVRDFRDILNDKSIDAVCISTPDHWHAYMTVE